MSYVPDLSVLATFAVASLLLAMTPGPDMTLWIKRALSEGRMSALACVVGTSTGIIVHTLLVAIGVSALVVASPTAFFVLKATGALYLLWLAARAVMAGSTFNLLPEKSRHTSLSANWMQGLMVNLLNPKVIIFFVTFLPQFVSADDPDITGKLIFLGLFLDLLSLPVAIGTVLIAGRLANWLSRNRMIMRLVDYSFAGVFSTFAIRILLIEER